MQTGLDLNVVNALTGGKLGTHDVPCPLCGPLKRKPVSERKRVLRIWRLEPAFATYHCARCGEKHQSCRRMGRSSMAHLISEQGGEQRTPLKGCVRVRSPYTPEQCSPMFAVRSKCSPAGASKPTRASRGRGGFQKGTSGNPGGDMIRLTCSLHLVSRADQACGSQNSAAGTLRTVVHSTLDQELATTIFTSAICAADRGDGIANIGTTRGE
jgi:hypothetical protein